MTLLLISDMCILSTHLSAACVICATTIYHQVMLDL